MVDYGVYFSVRSGTGRRNPVRSRPGDLRTAVIGKDGGPCNVGQIGVEDCRRLRVKFFFFASFNNFGCQTEVETGVKGNKRSVILFQQLEGVHFYCIDSLPVSRNMNHRENNNEARHPSPWFLISYRAHEPAIKKGFHAINHWDSTA